MKIFFIILIGMAGGVIGGMGMGGGTLLIPLLTLFCSMSQHKAQCLNLISFIPMSIAALCFHFKNKLIEIRYAIFIAIPAVLSGGLFAYIAKEISAKSLAKYFGIFLIILGIYQLVTSILTQNKGQKDTNSPKREH